MVTAIQAGFATFWGPYVYSHYKTEQDRITTVHDVLDALVFAFFTCLVAFEDVLFAIFPAYRDCLPIFPILMLSAVFTILCEGTVYGISIARRPIFDTIGIAMSSLGNIGLCILLVPRFGLLGAALALAAANGCMFLFRTLVGQHFYRTVRSPLKTLCGWAVCIAVCTMGCVLSGQFLLKGVLCLAALAVFVLIYRAEVRFGVDFIKSFLGKRRTGHSS